jgi:hypothetical protein
LGITTIHYLSAKIRSASSYARYFIAPSVCSQGLLER